ncbi:MAG: tetratricopeptide repeat protein [Candidatus Sericytochromatia bacterium]
MKKVINKFIISSLTLSFINVSYAETKMLIPPSEVLSIKQEYKNLGKMISENISDAINETSIFSMIENNQSTKVMNNLNFKPNNLDINNSIKVAKYFNANYIIPTNLEINNNNYILQGNIINTNSKLIKPFKVSSDNISDLQIKTINEIFKAQNIKLSDLQKNRIYNYINQTKNLKALSYYIDGIDYLEKHSYSGYEQAFILFSKAFNEDNKFQLANLLKVKTLLMSALLDSQLKQNNTNIVLQAENIFEQTLNSLKFKEYKDLYKIKALISFFKNNSNDAKQNIIKALSYNKYDAESLYISWLIKGKDNYFKELNDALNQNLFLSLLHSEEGDYYRFHSSIDEAVNSYNEALKLSSDNTQANFGLANIYLNTGRLDESISKYSEIIKSNKNLWAVYSGLGMAYKYKDMLKESAEMFSESIKINPNNYESHVDLGVIYTEQGELEKAIGEYKESIKLKPDNYQTHYYLGTVYKLNDNLEQSIDALKESIKLKPDFAEAYYNLGISYKKLGKLDEAISSYKQAIKLNEKYPEAYLNLGNLYIEKNNLNEAINNIKQSIKLNPKYSRAYNSLGSAYQKQGNLSEAINSYNQAIKLDPKSGTAYYNLSIIYRTQKKVKEALS